MNEKAIKYGENVRVKILRAIEQYIQEHGYSPSYREIGEMVGLKSISSINNHMRTLLLSGAVETDATIGTPRAIRLPGYEFVKKEAQNPKTMGDKIRAMSDEELAKYLVNFKNVFGEEYEGEQSCLDWLRAECEVAE